MTVAEEQISVDERRARVEDLLALRMRLQDIVKELNEEFDFEKPITPEVVTKDIVEIRARWAQEFDTDMEGKRQEDIAATKLLFRRAVGRNDFASGIAAQKHLSSLQGTIPQKMAPGNKDLLQLAAVAGAAVEGAQAAREQIEEARGAALPREIETEVQPADAEEDPDGPSFAKPPTSQLKVNPDDVGSG